MGLGNTAKKVQQLADLAEKLYKQVNEVLERVATLQTEVEAATEGVEAVRREQREQRAILEAVAAEQGVDVDAALEDSALDVGEGPDGDGEGGAPDEAEQAADGKA